MIVNVISKMKKSTVKSRISSLYRIKGKDWANRFSLFDNNVLYIIKRNGIVIESLDESDYTYSMIRKCLGHIYDGKKITLFGTYDPAKISNLYNVEVNKL